MIKKALQDLPALLPFGPYEPPQLWKRKDKKRREKRLDYVRHSLGPSLSIRFQRVRFVKCGLPLGLLEYGGARCYEFRATCADREDKIIL